MICEGNMLVRKKIIYNKMAYIKIFLLVCSVFILVFILKHTCSGHDKLIIIIKWLDNKLQI